MTRVFVADLTHTALGISALTFPLGAAYVTAYATQELGETFNFSLFKYPENLSQQIADVRPKVVAFSNFSWNLELGCRIAAWAKRQDPNCITVFGGPNFPVDRREQSAFLAFRPEIDFAFVNEGEIGFVELLRSLAEHDFDALSLKNTRTPLTNCCYLVGDELVRGEVERITNINVVPSPYLMGILDRFFDEPLVPMLETTRGCPFSCAFCADGLDSKNRVFRYDLDRTQAELDYIQKRVSGVDELIITDLNFGMYKQDNEAAKAIADLQTRTNWPNVVKASAGKNQPERVIQAASLLDGSWVIGSAVQSTDPTVLENIKRQNISTEAYKKFIDYSNRQGQNAQSYTEIILALPGDTVTTHFQSLRSGVDAQVDTVRMYQAMLLSGTEMASQGTRDKFELKTKYRIIPGCIGEYQLPGEKIRVAELEEIVIGSKDMAFEEYVSCRIMNLLIETYINNGLFDEIFSALRAIEVSPFDLLVHLHRSPDLYTGSMTAILESFEAETKNLFDTRDQALAASSDPELFAQYMSGELGGNELLHYRAQLYLELSDITTVLFEAIRQVLTDRELWGRQAEKYFRELSRFILCRKSGIHTRKEYFEEAFLFDFNQLKDVDYEIDPSATEPWEKPVRLSFYHSAAQASHIETALRLYENHPGGIGRMIQRNNLKSMYRQTAYAGAEGRSDASSSMSITN